MIKRMLRSQFIPVLKTRLLPYRLKFAGMVLAFAGAISAIIYIFFDYKFKIPVFAVYSSFLSTKYFTSFKTNFFDELTLLLLISGLALIVFTKEKNETEGLDSIRFRAFFRALIANTIFLLLSVIFVYGSGFIAILVVNIFSLFIFYLLFFYLRKREKKE
jgi:hypothetical protein